MNERMSGRRLKKKKRSKLLKKNELVCYNAEQSKAKQRTVPIREQKKKKECLLVISINQKKMSFEFMNSIYI